jgi:hypothetical protein
MKKTQLERVKFKLQRDGSISRNEAIRNYITRLSSIILRLKAEGYTFKSYDKGGDYVYELVNGEKVA